LSSIASLTREFTDTQIIRLNPEIKGQFPQWMGLAGGPEELSPSISSTVTCEGRTCLTTIAPLGGLLSDQFGFQLFPAEGTYSLSFSSLTNAVVSACGQVLADNWGPIAGPSGGPIRYLAAANKNQSTKVS
jgi:hypothetical protein